MRPAAASGAKPARRPATSATFENVRVPADSLLGGVCRRSTGRTLTLPTREGGRVPALCTSLGKAILAFSGAATRDAILAAPAPRLTPRTVVNPQHLRAALDRFQASGFAEDSEGTVLGARCIAARIFADDSGFATAAVSISYATGESIPPSALTRLRQTADAIAAHC